MPTASFQGSLGFLPSELAVVFRGRSRTLYRSMRCLASMEKMLTRERQARRGIPDGVNGLEGDESLPEGVRVTLTRIKDFVDDRERLTPEQIAVVWETFQNELRLVRESLDLCEMVFTKALPCVLEAVR